MEDKANIKTRVFISHSSQDKSFVKQLASELRYLFGIDVWYDKWEIAVGDSIVDKVFEGLEASDNLIIVLSQLSVSSRWVKEELNTAVMRRISENNIRILPVLIETCEIPAPLKHIRYADFRVSQEEGLSDLLESLVPGHYIWQSLAYLYDHLCLLCDKLAESELDTDASKSISKIHSLLESALNLRTEIELRRARQKRLDLNFFEKIGLLAEKGIDVRSQTWNAVVNFRASIAHIVNGHALNLRSFVFTLQKRYKIGDSSEAPKEALKKGMERLKDIMHNICFEQWDYDKLSRKNRNESRT